jgi:hypothetical protein
MKKYFIPFLALIIAGSLCAFTSKSTSGTSQQELYWYIVNSNNQSVQGTEVNSEPMTSQEAIDEGKILCSGNTSVDCARGFIDPLTATTNLPGEEQVKKN